MTSDDFVKLEVGDELSPELDHPNYKSGRLKVVTIDPRAVLTVNCKVLEALDVKSRVATYSKQVDENHSIDITYCDRWRKAMIKTTKEEYLAVGDRLSLIND